MSHSRKTRRNEFSVGRGRGVGRGDQKELQFDKLSWTEKQRVGLVSSVDETENSANGQLQTSKFEEACAKIRESNKKFLKDDQLYVSSEEDEDEDVSDKSSVLDKVISTYRVDDKADEAELRRTRVFLEDSVKSGANVCLICIASVKKTEAIWNCQGCFCIFHLPCIQTWAKDSVLQQSLGKTTELDAALIKWCCPKCRREYIRHEIPKKYTCFCGKLADPAFDPWLLPHSCGQICDRLLQPHCGHKCNLLCHPGPCPPCPQTVQVTCYCKRQKPNTRRCSKKEWSCGQPCGKVLSCSHHSCAHPCHPGVCSPCPRKSIQACLCGKVKSNRPCADTLWQCSNICGRELSCGFHKCETVCHSGSCGDCPRSKNRYCPCGKTSFQLPCTEDVPACGDTCGKLLTCLIHSCAQRCHFGNCGTCLQVGVKRCRCGQKEKSVPCSKEYLCEIKCKSMRDCGKHLCNRKCCDGNCPICEQVCGKTLGCRNHKCNSHCHQGPCYPCPLAVDVKCFCGSAKLTIPCGRERVTRPPKCSKRCEIPPKCHHSSLQHHRCHFGDCPQCSQTCAKTMTCGHLCPSVCHSAVVTKIQIEQKRAGPWEPQVAPRFDIVCQSCPPCKVPLPVTCLGKHETQDFPCFMAKPSSCGRQCGRMLSCGNHSCSLKCHHVQNAKSETTAGDNCTRCEEPCGLPRPAGCCHSCLLPCHPKPCPACRQMIRHQCHCQLNTLYIECDRWNSGNEEVRSGLLSCGDRCPKMMKCGHRCLSQCHSGPCTSSDDCRKKVTLRCSCKRIKTEFQCVNVERDEPKIPCDEACKEKLEMEKKIKVEEESKRKMEETKKEMEELERYKRMIGGKKRKPRKQKEVPEVKPFWTWNKIVPAVFAIVVTLVAICYKFF